MTSDGEVPRTDPHKVVEGEFQDETTVGAHLSNTELEQLITINEK